MKKLKTNFKLYKFYLMFFYLKKKFKPMTKKVIKYYKLFTTF